LPYFHSQCTQQRAENIFDPRITLPSTGDILVTGLFKFETQEPDELPFDKGDTIKVTAYSSAQWWGAQLRGAEGLIPCNYVVAHDVLPLPRDGSFMVWPISATHGPLCISARHGDHVDHILISVTYAENQFKYALCSGPVTENTTAVGPQCEERDFESLQKLIEHYRRVPLPWFPCEHAGDLTLTEGFSRTAASR
jgi:hypothetical protein